MNWLKTFYFKNGDTVSIECENLSVEDMINNINDELSSDNAIELFKDNQIIVVNIKEINYIDIRRIKYE